MKSSPKPAQPAIDSPPASFEAALQELETLVQALENGSGSLEEALLAYERGRRLLGFCQDTLAQAEQKIRILEQGGALKDLSAVIADKVDA